MIRVRTYLNNVLETDLTQDQLLSAGRLMDIRPDGEDVVFSVSLLRKKPLGGVLYFEENPEETDQRLFFRLRFYSNGIARLLMAPTPQNFIDDSPMLEWDPTLRVQPARMEETGESWRITGPGGADAALGKGKFSLALSPDGAAALDFQNEDRFMPNLQDALPAILLERTVGSRLLGFALHTPPGEHFGGAGEHFVRRG